MFFASRRRRRNNGRNKKKILRECAPALENHLASFGAQDIESILQNYTNDSEFTVIGTHSQPQVFCGIENIGSWFKSLFEKLSDLSGLELEPVQVLLGEEDDSNDKDSTASSSQSDDDSDVAAAVEPSRQRRTSSPSSKSDKATPVLRWVWRCPSHGYASVINTMVFDASGIKIVSQTVEIVQAPQQ